MDKDLLKLLYSGGKAAVSAVNPVAAGLSIIPEIGKGALALSQAIRARQLEKSTKRPVYAPPGSATEALNLQRNLAYGQAPGLSQATQLADRANAGANAAILDSGGGTAERMAALATVNQGAQESALQRGAMQAQYTTGQQQALAAGLNDYAKYQDEMFRYNKDAPFMAASQKAAELRDAANVNAYDMAKSIGGSVASTIGYNNLREGLKRVSPESKALGAKAAGFDFAKDGVRSKIKFDPNDPGSEANYDFNQIEKDAAAKAGGFGFDPNVGADQSYDFGSLTPAEKAANIGKRFGGGIEQPPDEERGLTALPDYPNRLNPITGKPISGIMPTGVDQRARRLAENLRRSRGDVYMPELDQMGNVGMHYGKSFGGGGPKKPVYTSDPNDPRIQAYQDSLLMANESDVTWPLWKKLDANGHKYTAKGYDDALKMISQSPASQAAENRFLDREKKGGDGNYPTNYHLQTSQYREKGDTRALREIMLKQFVQPVQPVVYKPSAGTATKPIVPKKPSFIPKYANSMQSRTPGMGEITPKVGGVNIDAPKMPAEPRMEKFYVGMDAHNEALRLAGKPYYGRNKQGHPIFIPSGDLGRQNNLGEADGKRERIGYLDGNGRLLK